MQTGLSSDLPELPAFWRFNQSTPLTEGWALYAEGLADELGLYVSDIQRLGMLALDAWRASRLVVDTGLHARGWSRDEAISFMRENTALSPQDCIDEVDRYIAGLARRCRKWASRRSVPCGATRSTCWEMRSTCAHSPTV